VPGNEPKGTKELGRKGAFRHFLPYAFLLLIAVAELAIGLAAKPSDAELRRMADEGTPRERVKSFFIRMNRSEPRPLSREALERILAEEPLLLREWTMSSGVGRFGSDYPLLAYVRSDAGTPHKERCRFFLNHRVGRCRWIKLEDLEAFLRAAEEE